MNSFINAALAAIPEHKSMKAGQGSFGALEANAAAPSTVEASVGLDASASLADPASENYLRQHAQREFAAAGWVNADGSFKDDMQALICKGVLTLLDVFADEGHSGFSAPYAINLFEKLAKLEPIVPLGGDDSEWTEVTGGCFQNKRCSHVFKQADRFDGQPYDIQAVVFYDWQERELEADEPGYPGTSRFKSHFTNGQSHRPITFPYTPTTVYEECVEDGK